MAQLLHTARNRCIAKLHTVPTAWFEPHRRAAIEARPLLAELPKGTVCWYLDSRSQHWLNESKPDWALKIFAEQEIKPATAAGSRVVTAHTDIHGMNVVQAPDGDLKVIDLESTTVMVSRCQSYTLLSSCKEGELRVLNSV